MYAPDGCLLQNICTDRENSLVQSGLSLHEPLQRGRKSPDRKPRRIRHRESPCRPPLPAPQWQTPWPCGDRRAARSRRRASGRRSGPPRAIHRDAPRPSRPCGADSPHSAAMRSLSFTRSSAALRISIPCFRVRSQHGNRRKFVDQLGDGVAFQDSALAAVHGERQCRRRAPRARCEPRPG